MYYHVRIATESDPSQTEVELDIGSDDLSDRFLIPYNQGRPIVISGKTVPSGDIDRISINETQQDSTSLNSIIKEQQRARRSIMPVDHRGRLPSHVLANQGEDVTARYITGPPGHEAQVYTQSIQELMPPTNAREVFVVHGRNLAARDALFEFLRALDLHPLEWAEAVSATGKPSPYIGEILDAAFSRAHAVVVLFTPDDEARLKRELRRDSDPPHETELTGQARPNVLFEAGMAMSRSQDRTILVELGNLRPFSDLGGRHTIRLDDSSQQRQDLAQRLGAAGCPVNLNGTDWHSAGDFDSAVLPTETNRENPDSPKNSLEETRFLEMLAGSRQLREHISQFLHSVNSDRTAFESQNIVIALGALASQMNALGMNELNERLQLPEDIRTKLDRILAMLGYFEMHIVDRKFEKAKQEFASYDPDNDDKVGYPEANNIP